MTLLRNHAKCEYNTRHLKCTCWDPLFKVIVGAYVYNMLLVFSLKELKKKDEDKKKLEHAMNDLESFIIDAQDKLVQDVYVECSTEEERETMTSQLSQAGDWIYDYDGEQTAKVRLHL